MTAHERITLESFVRNAQARGMDLWQAKDSLTREWVKQRLENNGNNQCVVALVEGVHRNTISRYIRELGVPLARGWKSNLAGRRRT